MGILPHVPKLKDKAKEKEPTGRAREDVVYWIGEDAGDCVVFTSTKPSPSEMTCRAFGSAPRSVYCRPPRWTPFRFGV